MSLHMESLIEGFIKINDFRQNGGFAKKKVESKHLYKINSVTINYEFRVTCIRTLFILRTTLQQKSHSIHYYLEKISEKLTWEIQDDQSKTLYLIYLKFWKTFSNMVCTKTKIDLLNSTSGYNGLNELWTIYI